MLHHRYKRCGCLYLWRDAAAFVKRCGCLCVHWQRDHCIGTWRWPLIAVYGWPVTQQRPTRQCPSLASMYTAGSTCRQSCRAVSGILILGVVLLVCMLPYRYCNDTGCLRACLPWSYSTVAGYRTVHGAPAAPERFSGMHGCSCNA